MSHVPAGRYKIRFTKGPLHYEKEGRLEAGKTEPVEVNLTFAPEEGEPLIAPPPEAQTIIHLQDTRPPSAAAQALLQSGVDRFNKQQFPEAIEFFNRAIQANGGTYVQARDNNFIAPNGSSFRLVTRYGQTITEAIPGAVEPIGSYQIETPLPVLDAALRNQVVQAGTPTRRYKIRPVGFDYSITVATRSTRQIQVQVTDENDRPVPDVPLIWGLRSASGRAIGSLQNAPTFQSVTNAQGIGTAPFEAGDVPGSAMFTVTIAGTTMTFSGGINVVRATGGFWNVPTATPVLATVVAAAIVAGVVIKKNAEAAPPIAPVLPIIIRP